MSDINNSIQPRLQYNYAKIDLSTCRCVGCKTYSYEIINQAYIPVPYITNDYLNKYYNLNGDQLWYHDSLFQNLWVECPSHNV